MYGSNLPIPSCLVIRVSMTHQWNINALTGTFMFHFGLEAGPNRL
jgi:hypothetical protein